MQRARACLAAGLGWAVRWSTLLLGSLCVLLPLPLLFVSFGESPLVPRAAFLLVLMSLSWALTPWSIYVTSLFPLVLMPVLGLAGASLTASLYWNDAICLFLGSFVVTAAMERWLLHKRLALRLILLARGSPRAMLAAVMCATALLSLFMSNTATAALMVPLVLPIIRRFELDDEAKGTEKESELSVDGEDVPLDQTSSPSGEEKKTANAQYGKSLLLGVAYSASMGGIGTLIGTGPNLTLVQMMRQLFPLYAGISFGAWAAFALVVTIVSLVLLWLLLVFWLNRGHLHLVRFPLEFYRLELQALGRLSFEEGVIVTLLVSMTLLWITRSGIPPSVPGWGALLGGKVQDGTICIGLSTVLFLIPSRSKPGSRLLEPSSIATLHWDVMLLLGAGFAIGFTFASSGLTTWIGFQLRALAAVPLPIVVLVVTTAASFWTEVCSNVATANILLPIMASLAAAIGQNPLVLMVPVTIACSLAFMLPVATPPNALVMAEGVVLPRDMMKLGFVMNWICVLLVSGWTMLGGRILGIELGVVPAWANSTNATLA